MSLASGGRTDRTTLAERFSGLDRVRTVVSNGARDGTLATVVGTILLVRTLRSRGYREAISQVVAGLAAFYVSGRQRQVAAVLSSGETLVDEIGSDERAQLDAKGSTPTDRQEPERELGGDVPGERSDAAFTADAETQGRSQPSLNADVHDPRRTAEDEELDLSETALADAAIGSDHRAQDDTAGVRAANDEAAADDQQTEADEGDDAAESDAASDTDQSDDDSSESDADGEGDESGTIPEDGMRQDETDPDAPQAGDDDSEGHEDRG